MKSYYLEISLGRTRKKSEIILQYMASSFKPELGAAGVRDDAVSQHLLFLSAAAGACAALDSHHASQIKKETGTKFKVSGNWGDELSQAAGAVDLAKPREKFLCYIHDILF